MRTLSLRNVSIEILLLLYKAKNQLFGPSPIHTPLILCYIFFQTSTGQILNPQQKAQVAKVQALLQQKQQQQQQMKNAAELQLLQRLRQQAQPNNG